MMETSLKHKKAKQLPEFAVSKGNEYLSALETAESNAKNVIKGGSELSSTLLEVAELVRKAVAHNSFVETMLAAAQKMSDKE